MREEVQIARADSRTLALGGSVGKARVGIHVASEVAGLIWNDFNVHWMSVVALHAPGELHYHPATFQGRQGEVGRVRLKIYDQI